MIPLSKMSTRACGNSNKHGHGHGHDDMEILKNLGHNTMAILQLIN